MNITTVNNTTGITNANVNLAQNSGSADRTQITVPSGLSPIEAGKALLMQLSAGDRLTGEIIDITPNNITISLNDSVTVKATLADSLSYNIGDMASFTIKDINKEQVVLKAGTDTNRNLFNDQTITSALKNAGLQVNEVTVSLVKEMMSHELPITSDSINHYMNLLTESTIASPKDVIYLEGMHIEVTDENVQALHDYYDFDRGMTGNATKLTDDLYGMINSLPSSVSDATVTLLSNFISSFTSEISEPVMIGNSVDAKELQKLSEVLLNSDNGEAGNATLQEFAAQVAEGKISSKEFFNRIIDFYKDGFISPDKFKEIVSSKGTENILKDFVRQEMFLNPSDISKENIKKLYSKVLQDTETLSSRFQGIKFAENMLNTNTQIKNDVSFLNQANNFMNFVQIPLRMSGHEGHGDLYVYKNNRKKIEDKDELKALLHLDMDNLGPMDVFVLLKAKNVTTNFKVASDDILTYIEEHISELNERLNALGYSVTSTVTSDKERYSFVKSVMEEEFPSVEIKRFSFDVRA